MDKKNIDFIITWVDGNDPEWRREKAKYDISIDSRWVDNRDERYRPMDTFRYLFRGIEKFCPWVNKVYLVTYGHKPDWLNTKGNDKLVLVKHSDFIPESFLPTFNAGPIEMNLHRIDGLSSQFVYFNDDMFIIKPCKQEDFFVQGKPCDSAVLNAISVNRIKGEKNVYLKPVVDMALVNTYFSKKKTIMEKPGNWINLKYGKELLRTIALSPWRHFTGFENWHLPYSIKRETIEEIWSLESEYLEEICTHKFRVGTDVNIWLFLYWQYAKNDFYPRSPKIGAHFSLTDSIEENRFRFESMITKKTKLLCLNDEVKHGSRFDIIEEHIREYFNSILPEKSSFEL